MVSIKRTLRTAKRSEAELPPQNDGATAIDCRCFVVECLTDNGQVRNPEIRVVEGVVELSANQETVAFLEFDRLLRREVPGLKARRDESISTDVSIAGSWDDEVKAIRVLGIAGVVCEKAGDDGIDARRQAKGCAVKASGGKRCAWIAEIGAIVVETIAVNVESVMHGLRCTGRKDDRA